MSKVCTVPLPWYMKEQFGLCSKMCAAHQPSTDMLVMLHYLVEGEQCLEEPALVAEQSLCSHPCSPFTCFGRQLTQMASFCNENRKACTKIPWREAPVNEIME